MDQAESIARLDFSTALSVSLLTALGAWLLLAVLSTVLIRKKCGKKPQYNI